MFLPPSDELPGREEVDADHPVTRQLGGKQPSATSHVNDHRTDRNVALDQRGRTSDRDNAACPPRLPFEVPSCSGLPGSSHIPHTAIMALVEVADASVSDAKP